MFFLHYPPLVLGANWKHLCTVWSLILHLHVKISGKLGQSPIGVLPEQFLHQNGYKYLNHTWKSLQSMQIHPTKAKSNVYSITLPRDKCWWSLNTAGHQGYVIKGKSKQKEVQLKYLLWKILQFSCIGFMINTSLICFFLLLSLSPLCILDASLSSDMRIASVFPPSVACLSILIRVFLQSRSFYFKKV